MNSKSDISGITPLSKHQGTEHAHHLYVIKLDGLDRDEFFIALRQRQIGVNVHYSPVHLQPYYREQFASRQGDCPVAEALQMVSLPIYPSMSDTDVETVVNAVAQTVSTMR